MVMTYIKFAKYMKKANEKDIKMVLERIDKETAEKWFQKIKEKFDF